MRRVALVRLVLAASGLVWIGCSSGSHGTPSDGGPDGRAGQGGHGGGAGDGSSGNAGRGGQTGGTGGGASGSGGQGGGAGGHGGGGGGTGGSAGLGGQSGGTGGTSTGSAGRGGQAGGTGGTSTGSAGRGGQGGGTGGTSTGSAGRGGQGGAAGTNNAGSGGGGTAGSGGATTTATGGLCAEGWCWLAPQLQGNTINAVFARTPSDVWLVGLDGIILHWNGTTFTPYDVTTDNVYGVWAASPTFALAAAYDYPNQTMYLLRWDGNTWSRWMDAPVSGGDGIWGTGENDFWVAGWPGAAHWDGTKFTVDATPTGNVISGAATNDIFIGPPEQTTIFHFDGTRWSKLPDAPDGVNSIAAMGGGKAWICAGTSLTTPVPAYWDGATWSTPDPTMTSCAHVFTPDGGSAWANSYTDVFEFSGGKWVSRYHGPQSIYTSAGTSASDIWAAGFGGEILRGGTQGLTELAHGRSGVTNRSVWPVAPNEAWVASPGAMGVLHWKDGQPADAWAAANARAVNDVMGRSASDLWAVGAAGLAAHYNGTSWTEVDLPGPNAPDLYGVWENSPTEVWAVGNNQTTWLYDGSRWRSYAASYPCGTAASDPTFGHHLWSDGQNVLTASGSCVLALPDKPTANAGFWNVAFSIPTGDLKGVWMTSDGYVFAAGYDVNLPKDQGLLARYKGPLDGSASGTLNVVTTARVMQDVWASSGTDAWAVGYSTILRWDGSTAPTRSKLATPVLWRIVGLPGSTERWVVGEDFAVLHHP